MPINKPLVIIISSPSGAGKSTVTKKLLGKIRDSYLTTSCTTRQPRPGEKNRIDYFFLTKKKFLILKRSNKFLETAKVFDNYYGTLKSEIKKKYGLILLDVDWQGARSIRKKIKKNCYSFFLLPPSIKELKSRLTKRHKDNLSIAKQRIRFAKKDIKFWSEYDHVFINDDLNKCVKQILKQIDIIKKKNLDIIFFKKFTKKF